MAVLGFDTATDLTCVAVTNPRGLVCESAQVPPGDGAGRPAHAEQLLPAVEECLGQAGGWAAIERIGVGVGPGSYTGLRIGLATARMLGRARGIEVFPVCTLDALAAGIAESGLAGSDPRIAATDARRDEAFVAVYGPDGTRLAGPDVCSRERLSDAVDLAGAGCLAAGDGALRFRAEFEAAGATVPAAAEPVNRLAARHVCHLAGSAVGPPPGAIEPIYLREPDARRWRERDDADRRG